MSNLPPGVSDSMIPGNTPEDVQYDNITTAVCELLERFGVPVDEAGSNAELESLDRIVEAVLEHWRSYYREREA